MMPGRREFLLLSLCMALPPGRLTAAVSRKGGLAWSTFVAQMTRLADQFAGADLSQRAVVERGVQMLSDLDIDSSDFESALQASFETGNRFWLWQRLVKERTINGGVLSIDSEQLVQLHDHPGATGILRIISGEAEVWQFDRVMEHPATGDSGEVQLKRVSHRVLKPGDIAVLTPDSGNIHALRAVSPQCSMLDFFMPPYSYSQRSWYQPVVENWFKSEIVRCRHVPQYEFSMT